MQDEVCAISCCSGRQSLDAERPSILRLKVSVLTAPTLLNRWGQYAGGDFSLIITAIWSQTSVAEEGSVMNETKLCHT